jgi:protein SCO1/2
VSLLCFAGCGEANAPAKPSLATARAPATDSTELDAHAHDMHHHAHANQAPPAEAPLSGESIYNATANFEDQHGTPLELTSLRGSAVLATMFYASCTSVCPLLISRLASIERALSPEARAHTQVLAITLDPARDTADALRRLAQRHGVDDARWHFVRTSKDSVREMAALLGIRYSFLPSGDISHSQVIALLDHSGTVVARLENATGDPAELITAIDRLSRAATMSPSAHAHR